jgi:catechol 2,3-dioxygenase-like lactoylglutathione lyase family enzyme
MRIHVSIKVKSLDESIAFYSALFGQDASKTRDAYANFRLDQPPIHLALLEGLPARAGGVSHLGIELPDADALQAWRTRLEHSGVSFEVEDEAQCCYARADKLWLTDPDGYRWEIWVRTGEYESMGATRLTEERVSKSATACCA